MSKKEELEHLKQLYVVISENLIPLRNELKKKRLYWLARYQCIKHPQKISIFPHRINTLCLLFLCIFALLLLCQQFIYSIVGVNDLFFAIAIITIPLISLALIHIISIIQYGIRTLRENKKLNCLKKRDISPILEKISFIEDLISHDSIMTQLSQLYWWNSKEESEADKILHIIEFFEQDNVPTLQIAIKKEEEFIVQKEALRKQTDKYYKEQIDAEINKIIRFRRKRKIKISKLWQYKKKSL